MYFWQIGKLCCLLKYIIIIYLKKTIFSYRVIALNLKTIRTWCKLDRVWFKTHIEGEKNIKQNMLGISVLTIISVSSHKYCLVKNWFYLDPNLKHEILINKDFHCLYISKCIFMYTMKSYLHLSMLHI